MPEHDRRAPSEDEPVEARALMPEVRHRSRSVKAYELAIVLPLLLWELTEAMHHGSLFDRPMLLLWVAAIALVDLLPVPTGSNLHFSLSFPLQMAVALIYPPPVAALAAFLGTSDHRELRKELPVLKALFIRGQIAISVLVESLVFHQFTQIGGRWWAVGPVVLAATVAGYLINAALVAYYFHLESGESVMMVFKEMHVGVFAEFVLSYMGLALFSVLVATSFVGAGPTSIVVFIAPLLFARQMFQRTHSLQVATDDLARREAEKEYQSLHDSLTDLPNRTLFMSALNAAIEKAVRRDTRVAVMIMDLDRFKEVNDTLGHHYGDVLLQQIGPRLNQVLREGDMLARLGGDEFGVLLPNLPSEEVAVSIAGRLVEELEQPLSVEGIALDVSASLGIALFPQHSEDVETLLRRADVAMYAAKAAGSGYEIYDQAFDQHKPERLSLIAQVRPAIEAEEFVLHFQPKLNIADGSIAGVEALVRWQHPERGLVFPDDFIPMVEHTVLLRPLTLYVLDGALRQWRDWQAAGLDIRVSVNLSARNLLDLELPDQVADALQRWEAPPGALVLELTESFLMSDPVRSIGVLDKLAGLGVELSIDDFGTGYSSLSYLQRLPIKEIKIDKSFVMRMDTRPNDAMIVNVTVDLGQNLGLRVVAEGVENQATWEMLNVLGCDVAQGYLLSKPLPAEKATEWMLSRAHPSTIPADVGPSDGQQAHLAAL
jgi:diguanylate cyclase (GGDEF)-like protein